MKRLAIVTILLVFAFCLTSCSDNFTVNSTTKNKQFLITVSEEESMTINTSDDCTSSDTTDDAIIYDTTEETIFKESSSDFTDFESAETEPSIKAITEPVIEVSAEPLTEPIDELETINNPPTSDFVSDSQMYTYVLNTNTKKFHYSNCPSAERIVERNYLEYTGYRQDVIAMNYSPCKKCNP